MQNKIVQLDLKPLQGQIKLIKFVKSNKFNNYTEKFDTLLFDQMNLIKFFKNRTYSKAADTRQFNLIKLI